MLYLGLLYFLFSIFCSVRCQQDIKSRDIADSATLNKVLLLPDKRSFSITDTLVPTIYMTFDDGPGIGSRVVANVAKNEHIAVTFFMVGLHYERASPRIASLYHRIADDPFYQILNHSYTHAYRNHYDDFYSDVGGAVDDIEYNQQLLSISEKVIRLPGSNAWRSSYVYNKWNFKRTPLIVDSLERKEYKVMGWDIEWHFNYNTLKLKEDSTSMMRKVHSQLTEGKSKLTNHLVLLMHDRSFRDERDSTALVSFIRMCKRRGYRFGYATNHPYF